MAVNFVLSGTKLAAGIFGHSHALIADAVESFADIFSSLIVWRGLVVAAAPADVRPRSLLLARVHGFCCWKAAAILATESAANSCRQSR